MVKAVRRGKSFQRVANEFHVAKSTVALWVERAQGKRLDRTDWTDRSPGQEIPHNCTAYHIEQCVLHLRKELKETSPLGEYGADAIKDEMKRRGCVVTLSRPASIEYLNAMVCSMARNDNVVHPLRRVGIYRMLLMGSQNSTNSISSKTCVLKVDSWYTFSTAFRFTADWYCLVLIVRCAWRSPYFVVLWRRQARHGRVVACLPARCGAG